MKILFHLIVVFVFLLVKDGNAQFYKRKINSYNDKGQRTGLWFFYWDDENKVPMSRAFYKNGYESKVSKEYHQNGKMRLKFRYYKDKRLKVKFYNEGRVLEAKGWAIMEYNKKDTHFYYQGKWKYFDGKRKLVRTGWYEKGVEVASSENQNQT
ncbi:MAG: hypothetical protein GXO89_00860 [Chlorobi bacterium]|nr:hypothetical protein [Chlorobiota bacterium]